MNRKKQRRDQFYTIQVKLCLIFLITFSCVFFVNLCIYANLYDKTTQVDQTYTSNANLMKLQKNLKQIQVVFSDYLNTKDRNALKEYYDCVNTHQELAQYLNEDVVDDQNYLMEKNIKNMADSYLDVTSQAIEAKQGRNIEKYHQYYNDATTLYGYLDDSIYGLNNLQFHSNSEHYQSLMDSMRFSETSNLIIMMITGIINIVVLLVLTRNLTRPLKQLAWTARQVGQGHMEVRMQIPNTKDEIRIVAEEFNRMVQSLRYYIQKQKESLELENAMKEKEILMETHLKDTQLKYLQAQINPHFLFNTLNAGAQLAMMEEADETYRYIHKVSEFFRYNIKKGDEITTLEKEIQLVDNYVYILNVRFSNEIILEKQIDEQAARALIPRMVLQPLVENCIKHGYSDIKGEKRIYLQATREDSCVCVSIRDEGKGMSPKRIREITSEGLRPVELEGESRGIGLDNLIGRLKLFYEQENVVEITSSGPGEGTEISIFIPWEERYYV
ncbi:MAG: histidine kinase [Lachnospiraceae bacterium]|nr:histidine kinase [Lachnospiraceae bacterium]